MKKFLLVLIIMLLVSTAAFADHNGFGIGLVVGGGGGAYGGVFYPGLSLKLPSFPVFWGLYTHMNPYFFGINITGDFYLVDTNLYSNTATNEDGTYKIKIDWYLGLGGAANLNFWHWGGAGFGLGIRVPVGLSWHVITPFEIALGFVPTFGVYAMNGYGGFWWDLGAELAFRLWLK
jgi:hypothetical protein